MCFVYVFSIVLALLLNCFGMKVMSDLKIELKQINDQQRTKPYVKWNTSFIIYADYSKYSQSADTQIRIKRELERHNCIVEKVLGKGMFGIVYKGKYGNKTVAIKIAAPITQQSDRVFNFEEDKSCCIRNCKPLCTHSESVHIGSIESAALMMASAVPDVIKIRAVGIVVSRENKSLLYFLTIMNFVEKSRTVKSFVQKCFKYNQTVLHQAYPSVNDFIKEIIQKLHNTSTALLHLGVYHNDLKYDNIIMNVEENNNVVETRNLCFNLKQPFHKKFKINFYLIDFGNAIIEKKKPFKISDINMMPYYRVYLPPELFDAKITQTLAWYLGVIMFEICSIQESSFKTFVIDVNVNGLKANFGCLISSCTYNGSNIPQYLTYLLSKNPLQRPKDVFQLLSGSVEIKINSRINSSVPSTFHLQNVHPQSVSTRKTSIGTMTI
jgi:serine/threonine protein kinase